MSYFYKGEFFDDLSDNEDEIYIRKLNKGLFIIGLGKSTGGFMIENGYVYYDIYPASPGNTHTSYFWMLESFLSKHIEGIQNFDRDTLEIIIRTIENTYESYIETFGCMLRKLDGELSTKSAK